MWSTRAFLYILAVGLVIDLLWLSVVANDFYTSALGSLYATNVNLVAALLVYLLISVGIVIFVLANPYVTSRGRAFSLGALFGFVLYGVYDLTNLAVIEGYPLIVVIVDMVWGSVLCGTLSFVGKIGWDK